MFFKGVSIATALAVIRMIDILISDLTDAYPPKTVIIWAKHTFHEDWYALLKLNSIQENTLRCPLNTKTWPTYVGGSSSVYMSTIKSTKDGACLMNTERFAVNFDI